MPRRCAALRSLDICSLRRSRARSACLGGACTNRVCCNPPNCAVFAELHECTAKATASRIQCPGETLAGCSASLCCAPSAST